MCTVIEQWQGHLMEAHQASLRDREWCNQGSTWALTAAKVEI